MQRICLIIVFIFFSMIFCGKQEIKLGTKHFVTAVRSQTEITIDGFLTEPVWNKTQKIHLRNSDTGEEIKDSCFSAYAFICHDGYYLYIAFVCHDRDIYSRFTQRDQHLWEDEAVEVFIDTDEHPNTYVEIECSPSNVVFDSYIVDPLNIDIEKTSKFNLPGVKTASYVEGTFNVRDDIDKKWIVEMAIPFNDIVEDFNEKILSSAEWKINFYRIDRDADGPVHYAWVPTQGRFHKPLLFGDLIFQ